MLWRYSVPDRVASACVSARASGAARGSGAGYVKVVEYVAKM